MQKIVTLEIRQQGKPPRRFEVEPGIYTIGRDDYCKIRLADESVDPRHAVLTITEDSFSIEDLDSAAGTFIGARRIDGRADVRKNTGVRLGPFTLLIDPVDDIQPAAPPAPRAPEPVKHKPKPPPETPVPAEAPAQPPAPEPIRVAEPASKPADIKAEQRRSIKQQIHRELVERLDIKRLASSKLDRQELEKRALKTIQTIVADVSGRLPAGVDPEALAREVYNEALALGPLEDFLADPSITEIMVNGPNQVYVEKEGKLVLTSQTFMDDTSVLAIIERIVSPLGRRIDESQPYVDARLPDGSRVNAIIHPLSLVGPCLTIRKFSKIPLADKDLVKFGTLTQTIADFARVCVLLRKNIVVSGGTGSGKTTLLNVLSAYLPHTDRIVTIEDAAELRLEQEHIVRLEARPPNIEGRGAVSIRDLVRNALRMRPDRIVVGECRGGEALDMLQAMNTGHDGSLTTIHANTPRDVISRMETMVLMSGMDLPVRAIREQIASAIDVIVHLARFSDGSRKIVKVTEVVGLEGDQITMQDIFEHVQTGVDANGRVVGEFKPTGSVPTFIEDVRARGLTIDRRMFDPLNRKD